MPAAPSHTRPAPLPRFLFGATYYPEHWDKKTRAADPDLMAAAGFNTVRMAEFAWDLMEPEEGRYDFSLFDQAIGELGDKGIATILCTPTATPPRWLTVKHPGIHRVRADGQAFTHGSRQHCCHSNEIFRDYSRKITSAMAEHYQDNLHVIGWQTDNEFLCHFSECFCPSCETAFRGILQEKFRGDIKALNDAWGTAFWAQTYRSFDDILLPRDNWPTHVNPAHKLDYHRFISWSVTRFQHDQVEILRDKNPGWLITHNGLFRQIDYRGEFTRDLDVLGYDVYPMFDSDPVNRRFSHAFNLDRTRAWSGNFMIMEHQSGPGGQANFFNDHPEPGEVRRLTYTSLARGADSLLYFRWRTCRFGAEQYWCGILDHDNNPRRRYDEIKRTGTELKTIGPELPGTSVTVQAAVAYADIDAVYSHTVLPFGLPNPNRIAEDIHSCLSAERYAAGCVHPADDLSKLKLFIIPHWTIIDPGWLHNLTQFVENGGVLVIGARTATRDKNNNVIAETAPGILRKLAGITVEEYGPQNNPEARPLQVDINGTEIRTAHWYEILESDGTATALSKWTSRHQAGKMAMSRNSVGKGQVIYAGTYLTRPIIEKLLPLLAEMSGLRKIWSDIPDGIEVVRRQGADKSLWFFINHNDTAAVVPSLPEGTDLISGKDSVEVKLLEANGVAVIRTNDR